MPAYVCDNKLSYETFSQILIACFLFDLPVLEGFDWHFQAPVHFTLSSVVNKSQQHKKFQRKVSWNRTLGCWVRSKNVTSVLWRFYNIDLWSPCHPMLTACFQNSFFRSWIARLVDSSARSKKSSKNFRRIRKRRKSFWPVDESSLRRSLVSGWTLSLARHQAPFAALREMKSSYKACGLL